MEGAGWQVWPLVAPPPGAAAAHAPPPAEPHAGSLAGCPALMQVHQPSSKAAGRGAGAPASAAGAAGRRPGTAALAPALHTPRHRLQDNPQAPSCAPAAHTKCPRGEIGVDNPIGGQRCWPGRGPAAACSPAAAGDPSKPARGLAQGGTRIMGPRSGRARSGAGWPACARKTLRSAFRNASGPGRRRARCGRVPQPPLPPPPRHRPSLSPLPRCTPLAARLRPACCLAVILEE